LKDLGGQLVDAVGREVGVERQGGVGQFADSSGAPFRKDSFVPRRKASDCSRLKRFIASSISVWSFSSP
jgi:hypothetical protein